MACDLCGAEGQMYKAEIEGTVMTVCEACSKFGKVTHRYKTHQEIKKEIKQKKIEAIRPKVIEKETIFIITEDYAQKVKQAREKMGLKQKEVAQRIGEKESLIHNIESGKFEPSIKTARKLEKFFKITLVEEHEEERTGKYSSGGEGMTLGDMIKIKK